MARVVETDEPTVVREEHVEHVHDTGRGWGGGAIAAVIILIIILIVLFLWRPWSGASTGGGTNVNVTAPTTGSGGQ